MSGNFFNGTFFSGGFFGAIVTVDSGPTPAGAPTSKRGRKRKWALIGDRLYHANDEEIRLLLDAYVAPTAEVEVPKVKSKPAPKAKPAQKVDVVVPPIVEPFADDFIRYKQALDDHMAQMLLEAMWRRREAEWREEDDIEVLLLH